MTEPTVIISNRSRTTIMVGLFLGMFIASFNGTVVEVCGPVIASELNGGALFAWMTVIYMLCETITIPIAGKLSDKYGRRPLFLIGCGIFLLGSLLAGLSNSIELFLFSRALQGFGGGIMIPVSTAAVGDLYDSHKRGKMLGMINSLFAIGSGIGPIIGGYIAEVTSWHWAFFVNVPLFIICFAIVASRYPKTERQSTERMDYLGTALISTAILIILLLFQFAGSKFDWFSAQSVLMILAVIILLFGFVIAEKKSQRSPDAIASVQEQDDCRIHAVSACDRNHNVRITRLHQLPRNQSARIHPDGSGDIHSGHGPRNDTHVVPERNAPGTHRIQDLADYRPHTVLCRPSCDVQYHS